MELAIVIAVVVVALVFDYTNGFHDAANAIATSISTRALTPRVALILAAVMNFVGALLGQEVAKTVQSVLTIDGVSENHGLVIILAGLLGAITWNLITWYFGLPSSSSHALIGGLVGAGLAGGVTVEWNTILEKVVIPMIASPMVGFTLAFVIMLSIMWIFRRRNPHKVQRGFRMLQVLSAAALALGHGLQDAQKTMGVIFLAVTTARLLLGDRRKPAAVDRVLGRRPRSRSAPTPVAGGSCAPWVAGSSTSTRPAASPPRPPARAVLYTTAFVFHAPISTTHTITSAIMGAGATKRFSAVRWGVARSIVTAWILTFPMAGSAAALIYVVCRFVFRLP